MAVLVGQGARHAAAQVGCDTLLMIGSSFPYTQFLPPFGQARGVQIDISGTMIGIRYPMEVNIVGDSRGTLQLSCRSSSRGLSPTPSGPSSPTPIARPLPWWATGPCR